MNISGHRSLVFTVYALVSSSPAFCILAPLTSSSLVILPALMSRLLNYIAAAQLEWYLWSPGSPSVSPTSLSSSNCFFFLPLCCLHTTSADDGHKATCHLCTTCHRGHPRVTVLYPFIFQVHTSLMKPKEPMTQQTQTQL